MTCKNCNRPTNEKFCPYCGQSTNVDRLNFKIILADFTESTLQMNKGLLFTLKEMTVRPGHSIREYIEGKRVSHYKPIAYLFALSTLYFLISKFFASETFLNSFLEGMIEAAAGAKDESQSTTIQTKLKTISDNYPLLMLILTPVFSLCSYIAFKGTAYNYLEHFVLNAYITGHQAILYSVMTILGIFVDSEISILVSMSYAFYVFWQFYTGTKRTTLIIPFIGTYLFNLVVIAVTLLPILLIIVGIK